MSATPYPPIADETIQWVVMPAGLRPAADGSWQARLSVLISPRLGDATRPRSSVGSTSLFRDWPQSLRQVLAEADPAKWRVPLTLEVDGRCYHVRARVLPHKPRDARGSMLWGRLFGERTLVEPFGGATGSARAARRASPSLLAYHPDRVEAIVRRRRIAVLAAALTAGDEMPMFEADRMPRLLAREDFTAAFLSGPTTAPATVAKVVAGMSELGSGERLVGEEGAAPPFVLGDPDHEARELERFQRFHAMPGQPVRPDLRFAATVEMPPATDVRHLPAAASQEEGALAMVEAGDRELAVLPAPGDLVNGSARLLRLAPHRSLQFEVQQGRWTTRVPPGSLYHVTLRIDSSSARVKVADLDAIWGNPLQLLLVLPAVELCRQSGPLLLESGTRPVVVQCGAEEDGSRGGVTPSAARFGLNPGDELTLGVREDRWTLSSIEVVLSGDDFGRQIALDAPVLGPLDPPSPRLVVLPPIPKAAKGSGAEADARLTLVNQTADEVDIRSAAGDPVTKLGREGRVFRVEQGRWMTELENVPDFHAVLSALSAYPAVRRALGLLLELEITADDLRTDCDDGAQPPAVDLLAALGSAGRMRVGKLPAAAGARHHRPWSAYETAPPAPQPLFYLASRPRSQSAISKGCLVDYGSRFAFVVEDADGAAFKVSHLAQQLAADRAIPAHPTESQPPRPAAPTMLPAARQLGYNLVDTLLLTETTEAMTRVSGLEREMAAAVTAGADDAAELYAEDLVLGLRIDARRSRNGQAEDWRPLCGRVGRYWFGVRHDTEPDLVHADEGHVALGGDEHTDNTGSALRLSRTVFRWAGWGLCVERPGRGIADDGSPDTRNEPGSRYNDQIPLEAHFDPPAAPASGQEPDRRFPRLRFQSAYEFRARVVDLAGHSLSVAEAEQTAPRASVFAGGVYQRVEPIDAPVFIPLQEVKEGSTADQLVIRSFDCGPTERNCWLLAPAKTSVELAELCGAFDRLPTPAAVFAAILAREEGLPIWAEDPGSAARPAVASGDEPTRPGGFDRRWLAKHWDARRERFVFPYLPDPFSAGAALQVIEAQNPPPIRLPFPGHHPLAAFDLETVQPLQVELTPGPWKVEVHGPKIRFRLPPAAIVTIRLSSLVQPADVRAMAHLDWIAAAARDARGDSGGLYFNQRLRLDKAEERVSDGLVAPITPVREITLVHAVQRPLPGVGDDSIRFSACALPQRQPDETIARVCGSVDLHAQSTGKVDFEAAWMDTVDDPGLRDWYEARGQAQAFQINVALGSPDVFPFREIHKFEDTKHRLVTYTAVATSRFVDYYPQQPVQTFTRSGKPQVLNVLSSRRPADPAPYYIVPTYRRETHAAKRKVEQVRRGGLRIYLHRGWFSSGQGERLAVLLPVDEFVELPGELADKVTGWAMDPIRRSAALPNRPLLRHFTGWAESELRHPIVVTLDDLPGPGCGKVEVVAVREVQIGGGHTKKVYDVRMEVAVAAYDVALDQAKGLLYCDVDVDLCGVPAYQPFIRLALARYQRDSISRDLALSGVVRAEFCQPAPDRTLTVKRLARERYEVSLAGTGFEALEPDWAADPAQGCSPPVSTAPGITVEVTVEQLTGPIDLPSAWKPLPGSTQQLVPRQTGPATWVWSGEVAIECKLLRRQRLVLRELEQLSGATRLSAAYAHDL